MTKKFTVEVEVGDKIEVGRFRNVICEIKDIEFEFNFLNLGLIMV